MLIAVDIDDTVADLLGIWIRDINRKFKTRLERKDITSWDIYKHVLDALNANAPDGTGVVIDPSDVYGLLTSDMYLEVESIEGALYGVKKLRDMGHRVVFVTSTPKGCEGAKLAWLIRHGFIDGTGSYGDGRVFSDYIEAHDKTLIKADILIDDRDKNVVDFPGATILFDRIHNRSLDWQNRARGWPDVLHFVDLIEKYPVAKKVPSITLDGVVTKHITEERCPEQVKAFREIIEEMYSLHLKKNADYSPLNLQGTGDIGVVVRSWDKMSRLMSLHGFNLSATFHGFSGSKEASNESVEDSWIDLANYAVIALLMRKGVWGK